ncbi:MULTISPECIES: hypothetical protein [unclassified Ornithinimicrobium]|uniref:hypothetical protein n=1 Tax=unclassified Ornithinimicrobium TaxID=2615080 RepID=UPI003855604C
MGLRFDADLTLTVDTGPAPDDPGRQLVGRLTGAGRTLTLRLEGLDALPLGVRLDTLRDQVSDTAAFLAGEDMVLVVEGVRGPIVSLGAVRPTLVDRAVTGSSQVALHDWRAALRMVRSRGRDGTPALSWLVPPPTPWPVVPTVDPPRRRRVTTTHDPLGGGSPRLVYYTAPPEYGGERRELLLRRGRTSIGSGGTDDLELAGLATGHVVVERSSDDDEYRVVPVPGTDTTVHGRPVTEPQALRTGAIVRAGTWTFTYVRDEYADHGRPYGGRQGGEFSRQRPQPPRPRYQR